MSDARRAAILAALTLIGFACALLLLTLLVRCVAVDEVPGAEPTPPAGGTSSGSPLARAGAQSSAATCPGLPVAIVGDARVGMADLPLRCTIDRPSSWPSACIWWSRSRDVKGLT
jgi:hypothetical protein